MQYQIFIFSRIVLCHFLKLLQATWSSLGSQSPLSVELMVMLIVELDLSLHEVLQVSERVLWFSGVCYPVLCVAGCALLCSNFPQMAEELAEI